MKTVTGLLLCLFLAAAFNPSFPKPIRNEVMLHPGDSFTAFTLEKGEWVYCQPLQPYPGWAWVGITSWLTAELDFEAWLGGVPSLNIRIGASPQNGVIPAFALEAMGQLISEPIDLLEDYSELDVIRDGLSIYAHLNASWALSNVFYLHLSAGTTHSESVEFREQASDGILFQNRWHPDFSISGDWRCSNTLSLHGTLSYGSTFLYLDNVPRKKQTVLAFRWAPFHNSQTSFFSVMRMELAFLSIRFDDVEKGFEGPMLFLYWQW